MSSDTPADNDALGADPVARRPWWLSVKGIGCLWLIALVLVAFVLFVADNFVLVEVRLGNLRIQARLAWVVIIAFGLGGVIGVIAGWVVSGRGFFRKGWLRS
jgi:hypothetical protein